MVAITRGSQTVTQGHVALYARDTRWRRAIARSLDEAGHSYQEAGSPPEIRRMLASQRFDVLALKVRDAEDAREVNEALDGLNLPPHGIVVGNVSALPPALSTQRRGTLRYVPGTLPARELSRLVDISISAGTWEDAAPENGGGARVEEVDMEEAIEAAASSLYAPARRKGQRFHTVVEGPVTHALANGPALRRTLVSLLKLAMATAPRGSLVTVDARAGRDDWLVSIRAQGPARAGRATGRLAEALQEQARALDTASNEIRGQGGLLWVEMPGPDALALCFTLPLPSGVEQTVTA